MRSIRSSSLIAVAFVALIAVPAGAVQQVAPTYVSSEPSDGEELHQAPDRVEVTFNEPLDGSSELSVKDSCGRRVDDGNVVVDANTMSVGIARTPSGHYIASYLAVGLGGITGETEGSFHFEVHAGEACGKGGGGGHGNHGNNNNNGGKGGNKGHQGHRGGNNRNDQHDGHRSGSTGGDHSSTEHGSGSTGHSSMSHTGNDDHDDMNHGGAGGNRHGNRHGDKHGKGHGGRHGDHSGSDDNAGVPRNFAAGETPFAEPNGTAVLLALGLSLAMGVLGGWFLRVSGAR